MSEESLLTSNTPAAPAPAPAAETPAAETPAAPAEAPAAEAPNDRFDFVLDKYRTEGRTEAEAMELQAKSYGELQAKLGAFTGAPESYEVGLSQDLQDAGVMFADDDPMLDLAKEYAKDSNMNQEGFNNLLELYGQQLLGEQEALLQQRGEEIKLLGPNAESRLENINAWASANLDAETVAGLQEAGQTAAGVKAIEQLIAKTQNSPVAPDASPAPSAPSDSAVKAMQFEKDENGNRRINTDPAFRKEYERKRDQLHGTHEHRTMVGG